MKLPAVAHATNPEILYSSSSLVGVGLCDESDQDTWDHEGA